MSHPFDPFQEPLPTWMGQAFPGTRAVFRGHDLHQDLYADGELGWFGLFLYSICGRQFAPNQIRFLQDLWAITSYPDARLWNNRVAALAGSARSTSTLAFAAGCAVTEAQLYGQQPVTMCADFLVRAAAAREAGKGISQIIADEIATYKYIKGYGRPMATMDRDERYAPFMAALARAGMQPGKYLQLALEVEECLIAENKPLRANYAAYISSGALDCGLSVPELSCYLYAFLLAGMPPGYLEALRRPEGATFALKCEQINYTGPAARNWD